MFDRDYAIESFIRGHKAILSQIDQVQNHLRFFYKARIQLRNLNDVLSSHLKRQDEKLFLFLQEHYKDDGKSLKMIEFLIHDLKELRIHALTFWDKYMMATGDVMERNFSKDFVEFSKAILTRLDIEEQYLFPLIEGTKRE